MELILIFVLGTLVASLALIGLLTPAAPRLEPRFSDLDVHILDCEPLHDA